MFIYPLISFGSSWVFLNLDHLHVRYAIGRQDNSIFNFSGRVTRKRTFHEKIRPLTFHHIFDPQEYLSDHSSNQGLCVPTCISLSILTSDSTTFSAIGKKEVRITNQLINFHSLLTKKNNQTFISLHKFKLLEDYNSPFPKRILDKRPHLAQFSGIAINVFRAQITRENNTTSIHLFPTLLSRFHENPSYKQIDCVQDNIEFWNTDTDNDKENVTPISNNFDTDITNHMLLIADLAKFLYSNSSVASKKSNGSRICQFIHRPCLSFFKHEEQLNAHKIICQPFPTKGRIRKRKPRNKILPNHIFKNQITGKTQPNALFFNRSHLKNTIKPLMLSSIDFESFLLDIPQTQTVPNSSTQKIHKIFCYSIAHKSLYEHLPLPRELASPRAMIYDHTKTAEEAFMMQLMTQLRSDTAAQTQFIIDSLNQDQGTPSYSSFTKDVKTAFDLTNHCAFCGNKFYSRRVSKQRTISSFRKFRFKYQVSRILPCKDHLHLSMASNLAA